MKRQLLLDTETTGFEYKNGHRIIEFAALEMVNRRLTGRNLHLFFNPERDIPIEATKVHGITLEKVKNKLVFKEHAEEIIEFINGAELIIHNAKFDLGFLDHHLKEIGKMPTLSYAIKAIDTLTIARGKFPGSRNSLDALCDRFKVDRSSRNYHGALIDCELLAYVYLELTKEQIALFDEEICNLETSRKQDTLITPLSMATYNLAEVVVTADEKQAHDNYLQALNKKGAS